MSMIGGWELLLIFAVALLLFGAKRLPEIARAMGNSVQEFKKAKRDVLEYCDTETETDAETQEPKKTNVDSKNEKFNS